MRISDWSSDVCSSDLGARHPSNMLFGRYVWNSIDASKLVTRTSGWIGAMARTLWRYYADVGQRLRARQSRYLTGGNSLIGRLKLSLDKRRVPLWLNTRLIELLRENGRVIGARVERNGVETAIGVRKGVILAAGGFGRIPKLGETNFPNPPNPVGSGSRAKITGEMGKDHS